MSAAHPERLGNLGLVAARQSLTGKDGGHPDHGLAVDHLDQAGLLKPRRKLTGRKCLAQRVERLLPRLRQRRTGRRSLLGRAWLCLEWDRGRIGLVGPALDIGC